MSGGQTRPDMEHGGSRKPTLVLRHELITALRNVRAYIGLKRNVEFCSLVTNLNGTLEEFLTFVVRGENLCSQVYLSMPPLYFFFSNHSRT